MLKKVLLYVWQLPQNIVGLFVILFNRAEKRADGTYRTDKGFGVSLGNYIIISRHAGMSTVYHEQGHQKQSLYLGWLYLFTIGILSASGNLIDRWFHKKWRYDQRVQWYYSLPWEHWADVLGGVVRGI